MRSRVQCVKIVFEYEGMDGIVILEIILKLFSAYGFKSNFFLREKKITVPLLIKKIKEKGYWPSGITSEDFEFRYGMVGNSDQSFFYIKENTGGLVDCWDDWIEKFLYEEKFIQGWIYDVDYDYWQTADDPLEYTSEKREYLHLPMKSNGLPYPLEKQIIDTSRNPGRWEFRMGYLEAIGSTMWLSDIFWNYVGFDKKERLLNTNWIRKEVYENGVIKLIAADECFSDESTADIQNNLRNLLYGD